MGHEISSWVNGSPSLLTKDQTQCLAMSLPLFLCLSFPVYVLLTSISHSSVCVCAPFGKGRGGVHTEMRGTPAQSYLGRERAESHQEPPLGYTWGATAMEGGYAALHANLSREPSSCHLTHRAQKHWHLINMKGIWTLLCKHVLKTVIFSPAVNRHICAGAWEHRDDIPWHFLRSMCHKADIKVDVQLTWRWIGCHKHW